MMFKTHLMFGLFLSLLLFSYFNLNPLVFILILVFCSILPDIDHGKSYIGRRLFFISFIIKWIFGHRKLIHSIIFATIIALLIRNFFELYWVPFYLGYLSHIFLDALTKQGVYVFYPSSFKIRGFIKTNGIIEKMFLVCLAVINLIYLIRVFI